MKLTEAQVEQMAEALEKADRRAAFEYARGIAAAQEVVQRLADQNLPGHTATLKIVAKNLAILAEIERLDAIDYVLDTASSAGAVP